MTHFIQHPTPQSARAIVFAVCPDEHLIEADRPLCLLPLGPKSIVQHVIESAVRCGARMVDVVISEGAQELRAMLGEGERWGIAIRIHLVADPLRPYGVFRFLRRPGSPDQSDSCLVLHTSSLVVNPQTATDAEFAAPDSAVLWDRVDGLWSGMARVSNSFLNEYGSDNLTYGELARLITEVPIVHRIQDTVLAVSTSAEILDAQMRVLHGEFPVLLENYRSAESGIWIGRNTRIHPSARIVAPVFISDHCEIEALASIGPGAFLGERTIIGRGAVVQNSIVLSLSSVGEELTLQDSIASRSVILNTRLGISLNVMNDLVLGDLGKRHIAQKLNSLASRTAGLILLLLQIV